MGYTLSAIPECSFYVGTGVYLGNSAQTMKKLNPGYLHIYGNEGAMPHADRMRSIELMGRTLIPDSHEIKPQPYK
jgi:hypothetical protein